MASPLATSINLTWEQPKGSADVVDSYEISYNFTVDECSGDEGNFPLVTVMLSGSLRNYTIMNSPTTPVEEDSTYSISLTALNSVGRSAMTIITNVTTNTAGVYHYS